jgi:peroxiredoxin Q/BCP
VSATSPKASAEPSVGDRAPAFSAVDQDGRRHALEDYEGRTVVLYFYPKDHTPGCTAESCDFRDAWPRIAAKGAVVLGVSPDDAASHARFRADLKLPFPLLADVDRAICEAYGVWKRKSMYGRTYLGVERSTFVIAGGRIKAAWRKVKVPGHVDEVIAAL